MQFLVEMTDRKLCLGVRFRRGEGLDWRCNVTSSISAWVIVNASEMDEKGEGGQKQFLKHGSIQKRGRWRM